MASLAGRQRRPGIMARPWLLTSVMLLMAPETPFALISMRSKAAQIEEGSDDDSDDAVGLPELLIMSSPLEKKISYVQLVNFEAVGQVVRPLIDAGLDQPYGVAYHAETGSLYVADYGLQKIFRYGLAVMPCKGGVESCGGLQWELVVKETQRAVVTDVLARWVGIDKGGNLFYTEEKRNSICRLSAHTLNDIGAGYTPAENLKHVTFNEAVALHNAGSSQDLVVDLYGSNAGAGELVNGPSGLSLDGAGNIVWGNTGGSSGRGSVVYGIARPKLDANMLPKPTDLAGIVDSPADVAFSAAMVIFSAQDKSLYGICNGMQRVTLLTDTFVVPRGIIWDGDNTAYVADHGADAVFSIPTGRCRRGIVKRKTVAFKGVYGLAMITAADPTSDAPMGDLAGALALPFD
mmetsp:Transcript_113430/g.360606  ORF Transcript_113430/g.360606 Transcript_113430/m.360606 type:complete len:405 (-) Transcript_113430:218-1432(-)